MSNQMILDFTTTSTRRPEILRRTYQSFKDNLRGVDMKQCRLFINVDPVGPGTTADVIAVAAEFFGEVIANTPETPNFAAAVKWCFGKPDKRCFHLEDDWELIEPVEIEAMFVVMYDNDCAVVNLRAYERFSARTKRIFLSPGLWKPMYIRSVGFDMKDSENPEVQLWTITDPWQGGCYWPSHVVLRDIGREWLAGSGLRKNIHRERGVNPWTHWVKA